jgi:O-antigen ligase
LYFFPNHQQNYYSLVKNKLLLLGTAFISVAYAFVLSGTGFEKHALTVLIGLPLFLVFLFNTDIIIIVAVSLLFVNINVLVYKIVVLSSIPVTISYFIMHQSEESKKITNPLIVPLVTYLSCMLPSFWNMHSFFSSLGNLLNFASMLLMVGILSTHIKDQKQIKSFMIAFMTLSILNGLNVIVEGVLTKQRVFGFAGIVYVDYVCVAILISVVTFFYFRNAKSIPFVVAGLVLFAGLLFTQTRSSIISLGLTSTFLLVFLFIDNKAFSINRKRLFIQLLISIAAAVFLFLILSSFVPEMLSRIKDLFSSKPHTAPDEPLVSNSIVSRFLIWHTALNAFIRHPIIGIGAYSFCFDSQFYRTIPLVLYKIWVKDMSPHITYLAVLTETGIVGFIGFAIFLISTLRMGLKSVTHSITNGQKYFSLGIFIIQIYVFFSMAVTDAWLWGQCGMLWSMILGISLANYNIIMRSNTLFGKE